MNRALFLEDLKKYGLAHDIPNISEKNAEFLKDILRKNQVVNMLEIGTANGYSTLQFAFELEKVGWCIDTIEFSQIAYEAAQDNFEKLGMEGTIHQYYWDAREILPLLEKSYDFIFIDGLKKASLEFFLLSWNKIKKGGIIVIDDVIKFRYKMENLYQYLEGNSIPYEINQIDPDDGIMILKK